MIAPFFADQFVELYHGDMREVLPALDVRADACITDPPYGETSLAWDRWPVGWPKLAADVTDRLWCFGTLGMFMDHAAEFADWKRPRSIVWEKHNGTGFGADFFKVVHELGGYFYRGRWAEAHEEVPREAATYDAKGRKSSRGGHLAHTGKITRTVYVDDGLRLVRSVMKHPSVRGGLHPTEKPGAVLDPLIRYSVPAGGLVLDPFAGSGSTLLTARSLGRRAVGIEADERYCEAAAKRLAEADLFMIGDAS